MSISGVTELPSLSSRTLLRFSDNVCTVKGRNILSIVVGLVGPIIFPLPGSDGLGGGSHALERRLARTLEFLFGAAEDGTGSSIGSSVGSLSFTDDVLIRAPIAVGNGLRRRSGHFPVLMLVDVKQAVRTGPYANSSPYSATNAST